MENPEQLYVKKFYLTEGVTAIWDDFFALGAPKEERIYERYYGPFKKEPDAILKREELEKIRGKKEFFGMELCKKLGIPEPTAILKSSVPPYDEKSYTPHSLVISYKIGYEFKPFES